jgi:hypothetical protein
MGQTRALLGTALLAVALLVTTTCCAEFYIWHDARGQPRVSNIPPSGMRDDGSIRSDFNPLSIAAQQAALRSRLKVRDRQLAAARAALQSGVVPEAESSRSK